MGAYTKKTWTDSVIEAANRADTSEERTLREILKGIIVIKGNPDLMPFPSDLENKICTGQVEETDLKTAHRIWTTQGIMHNTLSTLKKNCEPPELFWDYLTDKNKPRLRIISDPQKQMFSNLVQNLEDPEWVSALCQCAAGCGKFILSNSIWAKKGKKFCGQDCKEKYYGRKNKKQHQKTNKNPIESILVECPGNPDDPQDVKITPTECINPNGKNIRGIWKYTCPTCPHLKKRV